MKNEQQVKKPDQAGKFLFFSHRLYIHRSRIWGKGGVMFDRFVSGRTGYWLVKKFSRKKKTEWVARYLST